jgi:salicylate hydroxylase
MRVAISGVGVAGGVIATGLAGLPGVEVLAFERVGPDDHAVAGNGLNIGPNAMLALDTHMPALAGQLREVSLAWQQWRASTVGGELLVHLPLSEVAACPGLRIRWAELYRACRQQHAGVVRYHAEVETVHRPPGGGPLSVTVRGADGQTQRVDGIDLLIAAEGRFGGVRSQLCGVPEITYLGVANFRVLLQDDGEWPLDDLEQWFNGPNRLLAFRLRDGLVYLSGNLPIASGQDTPEHVKTAAWLRQSYTPADGVMAEVPGQLMERACRAAEESGLHWSRLQESTVRWQDSSGRVLYPGDAGHAMVPTLGQGATTAIEDGAVFVGMFRDALNEVGPSALSRGQGVPTLLQRFEKRRAGRVDFIRALSWEASDVIMADGFSLPKVRAKGEAAYCDKLRRLYGPA